MLSRRSRKVLAIVCSLVIPGSGQIAFQNRVGWGFVLLTVWLLVILITMGSTGSAYLIALVHLWAGVDAALGQQKKRAVPRPVRPRRRGERLRSRT